MAKSFLSKLGNVVKDFGSFAVPAAVAGGLTFASGGLLGPALIAGGGAGFRGFGANEEEERRRKQFKRQSAENKRAAAMAGFINTLSPVGAQPNAQQIDVPKAGFLETAAKGAEKGIQAYQTAQAVADTRRALNDERVRIAKENEIRDLQIAATKRESAQAGGVSRFALEQLGQSGVDRSIVEGAGKIGTQDVQSMLFKPGRSGTLPTITPPTLQQGLDTIQARTNQAARQQALGPRSNLSGDEARGFIDAQSAFQASQGVQRRAEEDSDFRRQDLELRKRIADDAEDTRRLLQEARDAAVSSNLRNEFRGKQTKDIAAFPVIQRVAENRARLTPLRDKLRKMEAGEISFKGIAGIDVIKSFLRVNDDAQVTEGDLALISGSAQSLYQKTIVDFRRIVEADDPTIVHPGMVATMLQSLDTLDEAVNSSAFQAIQDHRLSLERIGFEGVDSTLIDDITESAILAHGLFDPVQRAEEIELNKQLQDKAAELQSKLQAANVQATALAFGGNRGPGGRVELPSVPSSQGLVGRIGDALGGDGTTSRTDAALNSPASVGMLGLLGRSVAPFLNPDSGFSFQGIGDLPGVPLNQLARNERFEIVSQLRNLGIPESRIQSMTLDDIKKLRGGGGFSIGGTI